MSSLAAKKQEPEFPLIERVGALESAVHSLEIRFGKLEVKFEIKFDELQTRISKLEIKFDEFQVRIGELEIKVVKLDSKIDAVHDKLDSKIDAVHDKLDAKIESVRDEIRHVCAKLVEKIDATDAKADARHAATEKAQARQFQYLLAAFGAMIALYGTLAAAFFLH